MIVRPLKSATDSRLFLIPQSIHAALSGDLASHWGKGDFLPLVHPEVTWPAIFHHDDGWIAADKNPAIDPETGRPQSFMHFPVPQSQAIWTQSIEGAARISPFAQYLIAEHFMTLREQSESHDSTVGREFIEKYAACCQQWRAKWQQRHPDTTDQQINLAVTQLRFFDWFSLWLCLEERTEPHTFEETPSHRELHVEPRPDGRIVTTPWPWKVDNLHVAVGGYVVPDREYSGTTDLISEMTRWHRLEWTFVPA